jgi:hypothetical protein
MGVTGDPDGGRVHFNEKLDHLQARHPFRYNLATGALIGGILALIGFHWVIAVVYALSWAAVRAFLWGDGRILRRQYEARVARVAAEKAAKRRRS